MLRGFRRTCGGLESLRHHLAESQCIRSAASPRSGGRLKVLFEEHRLAARECFAETRLNFNKQLSRAPLLATTEPVISVGQRKPGSDVMNDVLFSCSSSKMVAAINSGGYCFVMCKLLQVGLIRELLLRTVPTRNSYSSRCKCTAE